MRQNRAPHKSWRMEAKEKGKIVSVHLGKLCEHSQKGARTEVSVCLLFNPKLASQRFYFNIPVSYTVDRFWWSLSGTTAPDWREKNPFIFQNTADKRVLYKGCVSL